MSYVVQQRGNLQYILLLFRHQTAAHCHAQVGNSSTVLRSQRIAVMQRGERGIHGVKARYLVSKGSRQEAGRFIAIDLGLSERTVEIHRSRVMKKMEAESLPHLVKMVMLTRS